MSLKQFLRRVFENRMTGWLSPERGIRAIILDHSREEPESKMSLLVGCRRRLLVPAIVVSLSVLPSAAAIAAAGQVRHTPVVEDLVTLLEARLPVREALEGAIRNAGLAGLESTESLLAHLDGLVTAISTGLRAATRTRTPTSFLDASEEVI